jgi:hypothetical protein
MRTDLAQYYHSKKPSVRLQYMTTKDEKMNFEINGTDLLMRDLNIFCTTKTNSRAVMEQLKQLAITNNTMGASIYDLGNVIKSESIAELTSVLKEAEDKVTSQKQAEMQQQQQMQQEMLQSQERQKQMDIQFRADEAEKNRQKDLTVAEIRAAGMGAMVDLNKNAQSDYLDALEGIKKEERYQDEMNLKRETALASRQQGDAKIEVEREKLQTQRDIANKQLQIAKENKNKYDQPSRKTK